MPEQTQKILELLEKSGPSFFGLLTRLTLRQDVAEDLMQELFVKLSKSRAFDKAHNQEAYARRSAINLAFDWREKMNQAVLRLSQIPDPAANDPSPLGRLIQKEQLQDMLNAITQLRRMTRVAFVMRYIQQCSYEQIARELGRDPHQVRALCSKAIAKIRAILQTGKSQNCNPEVSDA